MTLSFEKKLYAKLSDFVGRRLLVAFSGGKDSISLLHFLKKNEGIQGYSVAACHINHLSRKTSGWDEKFCADFCEDMDIPFVSYRVDVPRYCEVKKLSFEHGARIVRYRALRNAMKELGCDLLLTAHTKNDVVETFFTHAVQGASVFSLKGITEREGDLFRPMLDITTEEILEYIEKLKMKHAVDETNSDDSYLRNFVRNHITAELSQYRPGFENNIIGIMHDAIRFDSYLQEKLIPFIDVSDPSVMSVKRSIFDAMHEVEQEYLLHYMASKVFRVERRHIDEMKDLVYSDYSVRIDMPDGYKFEKSDKLLRLFHKRLVEKFDMIKQKGQKTIFIKHLGKKLTFGGEWIDKELTVRNRAVGDRIGSKKLKDIFIDKKLDLFIRDTSVIILSDNCIVWVENISSDDSISLSLDRKNLEL
jgi:tRNA(Ile)-lysidine synthase